MGFHSVSHRVAQGSNLSNGSNGSNATPIRPISWEV